MATHGQIADNSARPMEVGDHIGTAWPDQSQPTNRSTNNPIPKLQKHNNNPKHPTKRIFTFNFINQRIHTHLCEPHRGREKRENRREGRMIEKRFFRKKNWGKRKAE